MTERLAEMNNDNFYPITLIISDLNELKLINDRFGHRSGDELIRSVAEILLKHIHSDDIVVRYGGDEFITLLFKSSPHAVDTYMRAVKADCQVTLIHEHPISLAMGYAMKAMLHVR